jgi:outer membrane protein TolC
MNSGIKKTILVIFAVSFLLLPAMSRAQETNKAPLTLEQAIETALAQNPDALSARWNSVAAAAIRDGARARRLPAVKLRGTYDYTTEDQRLFPATADGEPGVFGRDLFATEVVISLPLYTGGRITSAITASELLRQASEGELVRTRETIVFNVTSLFYNMLAQREVISSFESAVAATQEHRRSIEEQVKAQKAARVDLLRAEVRLAELQEKLTRERNTLTIQRWALAALLGNQTDEAPDIAGSLQLTLPPDCPDSAVCMRIALAQRNDYMAALQQAGAQAEAIKSARAGHLPTVSAQASYGERWMYPINTDHSQEVGRIGLVAEFPLFEGGAIRAQVREQTARYHARQEQVRKLELQIRTEVETARADMASARERIATTSKAVEQARESFRIIREKYDLGKGAIVDVLDAQAAMVLSETTCARALADLAVSDARCKLAKGELIP